MTPALHFLLGLAVGFVLATFAAGWADYAGRPAWHFRLSWFLRRRRERRAGAAPKRLRPGRLPK